MNSTLLPETGFLRIGQIVGNTKKGIPAILPICRTSWYQGIAEGIYPKPIHIGRRSLWALSDILALLEKLQNEK